MQFRSGGHKRAVIKATRRKQVVALRAEGRNAREIATRLGVAESTVLTDIRALRKVGRIRGERWRPTPGQLAYQARRAAKRSELVQRIADLYEMGVPRAEICCLVGRAAQTVEGHCIRLRKEGRISRRYEPIEIDDEMARAIARLWREGATGGEIASRFGWTELRTRSVIFRLRIRGFDLPGRFEAKKELEALIEAQRRELASRNRAFRDPQHWTARSIDAPLTADGFTILDTLGDEDEALQELIGDPA